MLCAGVLTAGPGVCAPNIGAILYCEGRITGVLNSGFGCGAANNPVRLFIELIINLFIFQLTKRVSTFKRASIKLGLTSKCNAKMFHQPTQTHWKDSHEKIINQNKNSIKFFFINKKLFFIQFSLIKNSWKSLHDNWIKVLWDISTICDDFIDPGIVGTNLLENRRSSVAETSSAQHTCQETIAIKTRSNASCARCGVSSCLSAKNSFWNAIGVNPVICALITIQNRHRKINLLGAEGSFDVIGLSTESNQIA
jgi:hypothetical protein